MNLDVHRAASSGNLEKLRQVYKFRPQRINEQQQVKTSAARSHLTCWSAEWADASARGCAVRARESCRNAIASEGGSERRHNTSELTAISQSLCGAQRCLAECGAQRCLADCGAQCCLAEGANDTIAYGSHKQHSGAPGSTLEPDCRPS